MTVLLILFIDSISLGLRYFIVFAEIETESRNSAGCVFLLFWLKKAL
jgi:hypothetical protein